MTTAASWHYIFLINVPIGVIAVTGIALTLQETRDRSAPRGIDVPGALLSAAALFAIVFALIEGAQLGWDSPLILGCLTGGVLLLVIFVVVERRTAHPLVDMRLFTDRLFALGNLLRGAVEFITLGVYFPLALFLQVVLGYSALDTGLALLPLVAGSFVSSPLAGALSDRIDVRWVVIPGLLTAAAGVAWLSRLSPESTWESLLGPLAVLGLGLGSLYGTTTSATLRNVPENQSGVASGISYTAFLLGSELGLVAVAAVVQSRLTSAIEGPATALGLPASAIEDLGSSLGSPDSDATATGGLPPELVEAFSAAFTDAVSTALLVCAALAAACAGLAIALVSKDGHPARTTDSDSIRRADPIDDHQARQRRKSSHERPRQASQRRASPR